MNRKAAKVVAIIIAFAMIITSLSFIVFLPSAFGAEDYENLYGVTTLGEQRYLTEKTRELESYIKWIHDNYKDKVDYETLVNGAFEGAMDSLGDPYSVFFVDDEEGQAFLEVSMGVYGGIGVTLKAGASGLCEITALSPGAPAEKAGIKVGDQIVKIDGTDVSSNSVEEISAKLRGEAKTKVTLVIKRDGKEQSFTLTRAEVYIISVASEMLDGNIGYISLSGFGVDGASQFRNAKDKLIQQGAKALIIDIRDNGGGLIDTAVDIADEIMPAGKVIFHIEQQGEVLISIKTENVDKIDLPIVLLVNEYSASASEILAGALQDNKAATLVGTTTYGKGIAQVTRTTSEGKLYKLSNFDFLTPDKHVIQYEGITPDVVVRNSLGEFRMDALEMYLSFAPFAEISKPKAGDIGLNVYAAQQRLFLLGYDLNINGTMDEATVSAVKAFQKEQGLYSYGTLDLTTMSKIEAEVISYIENDSEEDLQLKKAIELVSGHV